MPIYRKTAVAPYLEELDTYYRKLREQLQKAPSADLAVHFGATPEEFERDFAYVDLDRLSAAIAHFKVSVDQLKGLKDKQKQATKRHVL